MINNIDNEALKARYCPEGSKLRKNQKMLLEILLDLADICNKNNIKWWLSSGTLLGAARHNGFILWDDDADVIMTLDNLEKFSKAFKTEADEKFVLCDRFSERHYPYT
jgi:lipopolysaccharide cholinephosphotransferase